MFSIWCYYLCTCTCVFVCLCESVFSCACDYDRALSAFPNLIGPPPTPGTKIAPLNISFVLIEVREVNEVAGTSTIKFATKREWFDPRLLFQDLVEGKGELTPKESEEIWTPWTTFANLRDKNAWLDTDKLKEFRLDLRDTIKIDPTKPNYNGTNVAISYERETVIEFMCSFDMFWYPFDR